MEFSECVVINVVMNISWLTNSLSVGTRIPIVTANDGF
jgi:hypothetical protein